MPPVQSQGCLARLPLAVAAVVFASAAAVARERPRIDWDGPVVVEAVSAWADSAQRLTRLDGGIVFNHYQWRLRAEHAEILGPLDAPDSVRVEGDPASFVLRETPQRPQIEVRGRVIEYSRLDDRLTITGEAELIEGRKYFRGRHLDYRLDSRHLSSRGPVRLHYEPARRE